MAVARLLRLLSPYSGLASQERTQIALGHGTIHQEKSPQRQEGPKGMLLIMNLSDVCWGVIPFKAKPRFPHCLQEKKWKSLTLDTQFLWKPQQASLNLKVLLWCDCSPPWNRVLWVYFITKDASIILIHNDLQTTDPAILTSCITETPFSSSPHSNFCLLTGFL